MGKGKYALSSIFERNFFNLGTSWSKSIKLDNNGWFYMLLQNDNTDLFYSFTSKQ
jgi:hypothetical protein